MRNVCRCRRRGSCAVAILLLPDAVQAARDRALRGPDGDGGDPGRDRALGHRQAGHRLHLLGQLRLHRRPGLRLRRRGRRLGAWPPIMESHVEMDGAWALYEGWLKIQMGYAESALVFGFGRASMGDAARDAEPPARSVHAGPARASTRISMAALQARALLDGTDHTEREMAEVAVRSRRDAKDNPLAQVKGDFEVEKLLAEPTLVSPLRKHDCPPITDGAVAAGDRLRGARAQGLREAGVDPRHGPPHRAAPAGAARPHEVAVDRSSPRRRPARPGQPRRGRAARALHPPGADPARRAGAGRRREGSTPRAAPWRPTRSWWRASRASARPRARSSRGTRDAPSPTRPRAMPAAEPRLRAGG